MRQSENEVDRTPPRTHTKDLVPIVKVNKVNANTEPDGTLYILTPVQKTKPQETPPKSQTQTPSAAKTKTKPAQTALVPAAQTTSVSASTSVAPYPQDLRNNRNPQNVRKSQNQKNNKKKSPPVKRLINRFRKNGLGIIDSYFNAYFFYYDWKSEKKGRKPKAYLKTIARHPKGWAKKTNEAVYEKNIYDRYIALMTGAAKITGAVSSVLAPVGKFFKSIGNFFSNLKNSPKAKTLENIADITKKTCQLVVPAAVMIFTIMAMTNINSFKPQLELTLNGQEIGFVSSKDTVEKAVGLLEQTVSGVLNEPYEFTGNINYRIILSKTDVYVSAGQIYEIMYNSSQSAIKSAYGLYIDGELVGAAENEDDINKVLTEVLEEFAEKIDGENVEFANDIKIVEDKYAVRDVVTQDELKSIITYSPDNTENIQDTPNIENVMFSSYSVQSVQAIDSKSRDNMQIADSGIPLANGSLFADESAESSVGAEDLAVMAAATSLDLTPESINTIPRGFLDSASGSSDESGAAGNILSRITKSTANTAANALQFKNTQLETYTKTLPFDVKYVESANYYTGTQIVQKNGVNGEEKITADVTYIGENEVAREILEIEIVREPVSKVVVIGTKPKPLPGPTGGFIRPVKGGYTTSRFKGGHRGVDLVVPFGTQIVASDGGTVIYAGFSGSYGNHVKIRHSDGFVTLYAHLSSIGVKNGDKVFQGQEIGKVGSTGNSSGNHLHFEIIKNGVLVNPESYMK